MADKIVGVKGFGFTCNCYAPRLGLSFEELETRTVAIVPVKIQFDSDRVLMTYRCSMGRSCFNEGCEYARGWKKTGNDN